jgi:hypothetical protein
LKFLPDVSEFMGQFVSTIRHPAKTAPRRFSYYLRRVRALYQPDNARWRKRSQISIGVSAKISIK